MSHAKGWLGTCHGRWLDHGKPCEGVLHQRCSACGKLRTRQVRPCLFFHRWKNRGRREYGVQRQTCRRCGTGREVQARPCLLFHVMVTSRQDPVPHCSRCGEYGDDAVAA